MEAQRLMLDDTLVQLEATLLQTFPAARVAGIENRHIIFFGHFINRGEQRGEVFLGVDILFPMGRKQNIFTLFQSQTSMDIGCFDFSQILM